MKRSRLISMLTVAATAAMWPARGGAEPEPLWKHIRVGQPFPHFRTTASDGRVLHLPATDGRATVLAFWSPECGCNTTIPRLLQDANRYAASMLIVGLVIARNADSDREIAAAQATFPIANISLADTSMFFRHAIELPQTMLIDRAGVLREIVLGDDRTQHLAHRIAALR
jgi:peroxiredoxin